jgi:hypothetical protein
VNAAKAFLRAKITLDAYAASHRAVREMMETGNFPKE